MQKETLFDEEFKVDDIEAIVADINTDEIETESGKIAETLVEKLSSFYYNEEFMAKNQSLKKRVDAELDSLKTLIKMKKTDEKVHDILIKNISANTSNASLYRSLVELQKTVLAISAKINETVNNIKNMLKEYNVDMSDRDEFNNQKDEVIEQSGNTFRGSKDFIISQKNKGVI